jgi:alkylation response protein AidB-like acyl-CoA dehydrogenase
VDFTLSSDQELIRDTARSLLANECPPELVRAHIDDPAVAEPLWAKLADWTVVGANGWADLCLFLEETGVVLAPGPFFATTALFSSLLAGVGDELAPKAGAGELTGTVAMADARGTWSPHGSPVKGFVLEADRVELVAAVVPGPQLLLYRRPPARRVETIDFSRRVFEVDLSELSPITPPVPLAQERLDEWMDRAVVALAAEIMGSVRWLFDTTLAYAKAREQFDRPIGSFQAIKHKLANMALLREEAWSAVYYAAMTIDASDPERHRAAHVAKIMAGEAARANAKDGIQIHGGIGFTWEHDLHLYIRRAFASEALLGTSDWHRDRLADLVLPAASDRGLTK